MSVVKDTQKCYCMDLHCSTVCTYVCDAEGYTGWWSVLSVTSTILQLKTAPDHCDCGTWCLSLLPANQHQLLTLCYVSNFRFKFSHHFLTCCHVFTVCLVSVWLLNSNTALSGCIVYTELRYRIRKYCGTHIQGRI